MKHSLLAFMVLFSTFMGSSAKANTIILRDPGNINGNRISASTCGNGENDMTIEYAMGNFGMGINNVKVYVTFNGRAVGSAYTYSQRGSGFLGFANLNCSLFYGHGQVALYFVDDNKHHDDNYGKGFRFQI